MKQRLALAMALVGDPDLLILDEPSTGLDPNGAREMREIVREERDRGATVFFSSHILGQVEAVCDRVGILREGEVVAVDSVEGLREAADAESTLTIDVDTIPDGLVDRLREIGGVTRVDSEGTTLTVGCGDDAKTAILNAVEEEASVENFSTDEASLEELFAAYTTGDEAVGADEDGRETGDDTDDAAESGVAETDTTRTEDDGSEDGNFGAEKSEADDTAADEEVER
jgi:ABC-2 type transport system ATP-binding protein